MDEERVVLLGTIQERVVLLGTIQEHQSVDIRSPYVCKAGGTPVGIGIEGIG
jgi:hypothetical protein